MSATSSIVYPSISNSTMTSRCAASSVESASAARFAPCIRSHHRPPWDELSALANQIGVVELGDVGQIMHSSGQSGAQVHRTLLERADSLRDELRAEALARAEATTGKLEVPGAVLLVVLAAFVIYPITQRVFG